MSFSNLKIIQNISLLILSHNKISDLSGLKYLNFEGLITLDLSKYTWNMIVHNRIDEISSFLGCKMGKL